MSISYGNGSAQILIVNPIFLGILPESPHPFQNYLSFGEELRKTSPLAEKNPLISKSLDVL